MKVHPRISIKNPCKEQFANFKSTEKGGFCNSCKKEVIDFTKMSKAQIVDHLEAQQGKTCGYFKAEQLESTLVESVNAINVKRNYFKAALVAGITLATPAIINAQDTVKIEQHITVANQEKETPIKTGIIKDVDGAPLPGVNIVLKGSAIGTVSDFDGEFYFPKPLQKGDQLVVSYIGYKTQTLTIEAPSTLLEVPLAIDMQIEQCVLMGEVEVNRVYTSKQTLWQRIKAIF